MFTHTANVLYVCQPDVEFCVYFLAAFSGCSGWARLSWRFFRKNGWFVLNNRMLIVILAFGMVVTRVHPIGELLHLWDASWAVFFIAGALLKKPLYFWGLMLEAVAIDAWALGVQGVGQACLTSGYAFLVPAYAALFYIGRRYTPRFSFVNDLGVSQMVRLSCVAALAATAAFFISNLGYFLFAPEAKELTVFEYAQKVSPYWLSYTGVLLAYVALYRAGEYVWSKKNKLHSHIVSSSVS